MATLVLICDSEIFAITTQTEIKLQYFVIKFLRSIRVNLKKYTQQIFLHVKSNRSLIISVFFSKRGYLNVTTLSRSAN